MSAENPFLGNYLRLRDSFREAIVCPGELHFTLVWHRKWLLPGESYPAPPTKICHLGSPFRQPRPEGPKNWLSGYVDEINPDPSASRPRFLELAAEAGSALPALFRNRLRKDYWHAFIDTPVTRRCALLFALVENDQETTAFDPMDDSLLVVDCPFSASCDAITICGLATDHPMLPHLERRHPVPAVDGERTEQDEWLRLLSDAHRTVKCLVESDYRRAGLRLIGREIERCVKQPDEISPDVKWMSELAAEMSWNKIKTGIDYLKKKLEPVFIRADLPIGVRQRGGCVRLFEKEGRR